MSLRVGINGFGRMGRLALRAAIEGAARRIDGPGRPAADAPAYEIVHINEIKGGVETAAHLLEFDSVHGRWPVPVEVADGTLRVAGQPIGFSAHPVPSAVPWRDLGVELVLECSGKFNAVAALTPVLDGGVKTVLVAAPVKEDGALNLVLGVNDHLYDPARHRIVTAASCTTNCLAPVVKVLHEAIGIRHGVITTIHDATNTQVLVDAPHKDLRRARSALTSLIPTTTGSATAIGVIYPDLQGRLNGHAVRVPLLTGSLTDCVFEMARETSVAELNGLLRDAAAGPLAGILGFEDRPLVSVDFVHDPRSGIVDGPSTMVVNGTSAKLFVWYDNEWGYATRLAELAARLAAHLDTGR